MLTWKELLVAMLAVFSGNILIEFDHPLPYSFFHFFPVPSFFLILAIALIVWRDKNEKIQKN